MRLLRHPCCLQTTQHTFHLPDSTKTDSYLLAIFHSRTDSASTRSIFYKQPKSAFFVIPTKKIKRCILHSSVGCLVRHSNQTLTSGQRSLTKGRIAGGADFSCNVKWVAAVTLSCWYSGVNDPFCCMPLLATEWSLLLRTPQQRLPMLLNGLDNPKIALPVGRSQPPI